MKTINQRTTEYDIDDIFLKRYSPRAMSGKIISREELMTLFEAARWAPSAFNNQSWRFLYAINGTPDFDLFFSFLNEGNKSWCKKAGALVIGLSKKTSDDGRPSPKHSLDIGAAWENLALQATTINLVAHGMSGFNEEITRKELNISDDYQIELMIAIGDHGKTEDLPEKMQAGEKPSDRKKLEEIVFEGVEGTKKLI
jgi:nitroreductase